VAGHILFTPVTVGEDDAVRPAIALGPMSVLPSFQRQGIGGALVRAGLEECRRSGRPLVFVLGHPEYYPRFGFVPTASRGIRWEHPAPEEAFLLVELEGGAADGVRGVVRYHPRFSGT
jgi:putative acetyltransferase